MLPLATTKPLASNERASFFREVTSVLDRMLIEEVLLTLKLPSAKDAFVKLLPEVGRTGHRLPRGDLPLRLAMKLAEPEPKMLLSESKERAPLFCFVRV